MFLNISSSFCLEFQCQIFQKAVSNASISLQERLQSLFSEHYQMKKAYDKDALSNEKMITKRSVVNFQRSFLHGSKLCNASR